jgi:RNA polymerase sigma-70 factor (ECF subfamily)
LVIDDEETEELLRRAGRGDGPAVQELLGRHRDRLRRMISVRMDPRLVARVDPSDVIQEATAEAARRLPEYLRRRGCPFYPWLRGIAWERLVQLHRRHVKAQRRSVTREERWEMDLPDGSAMRLAETLLASGSSPSQRMIRRELRQRVEEAMGRLPAPAREVVVLRHLEQLPFKDVAAVQGISLAAAQSRYRRAVERLHDMLADESEDLR